ncbi:MAG: DUF4340 domain-containing protein [Oligoflexia bacterium]|nr:DUF4340 domain-containing protein [Oligoflexia bacterium]
MKRFKSSLILLGVFLLVFIYVYFVEYRLGEKKKIEKENSEKIYNTETEEIKKIGIKRGNDRKWSLIIEQNKDKKWFIVEPVSKSADVAAVNNMLSSLNTKASIIVENEKEPDLAPYGLSGPEITAVFYYEDGKEVTLLIGDKTPVGDDRYVYIKDSGRVLAAARTLYDNFDKDEKTARSKLVYELNKDDVTKIRIKRKKETVALERGKTQYEWFLTSPVKAKANRHIAERFIDVFASLKVSGFTMNNNWKKFGLDKPDLSVEIFMKGKKPVQRFYLKGEYLGIEGEREVFTVYRNAFADIEKKKVEDIREKPKTKAPEKAGDAK